MTHSHMFSFQASPRLHSEFDTEAQAWHYRIYGDQDLQQHEGGSRLEVEVAGWVVDVMTTSKGKHRLMMVEDGSSWLRMANGLMDDALNVLTLLTIHCQRFNKPPKNNYVY